MEKEAVWVKYNQCKKQLRTRLPIGIATTIMIIFTVSAGIYLVNQTRIEKSDPLIFIGNSDLAPIVYDDHGQATGLAVDLAEAIGKSIDQDIIIKTMDWNKAQQQVLDGEADGLIHMNINDHRQQLFSFSDELILSEFAIFTRLTNRRVKRINDLSGTSVGVEQSSYPYQLIQKYEDITPKVIENWEMAFNQLASGELEAILVDRWIGEYELAKSRVTGIKIVEEPVDETYSSMAVVKGNDALLSQLNQGIKDIKASGELSDIQEDWSGERIVYMTENRLNRYLLVSVITILSVIILAVVIVMIKLRKVNQALEQEVSRRTSELQQKNRELRRLNRRLETMSLIDKLTMIPNRRRFDMEIEKSWPIKKQEQQWLAVILIDIDYFKEFNDCYGHIAGDKCLKKVAQSVQAVLKNPGDIVARYGGEEFIIQLLRQDKHQAKAVAEEMRMAVKALKIANNKQPLTISLGVSAVIPHDGLTLETLIHQADVALYDAKQRGRDCVVVYKKSSKQITNPNQ